MARCAQLDSTGFLRNKLAQIDIYVLFHVTLIKHALLTVIPQLREMWWVKKIVKLSSWPAMFVLSPEVGPPYFAFVFVLGCINPSFSNSSPTATTTTTTTTTSSVCLLTFSCFSPERGDRKSGNHSHVLSESVRSAELFQFKTSEKFCPLSFTRLCLPCVVCCISSPLAALAPVYVLSWPLTKNEGK